MANRILLVLPVASASLGDIEERLSAAGYDVACIASLDRAEHYETDMVVVSADTTDEIAAECAAVRRHTSLKEVALLLVAPQRLADDVDPAMGMDDILLSPWSVEELQLRVALALWRKGHTGAASSVLKIGDITIDTANYIVRYKGQQLDMTLKEYELLSYLASNPARVFTRAALLNNVWGYEYFGGTRTVDVHVRRLRAKLGDWNEEIIQTVRGVGYRFSADYGQRETSAESYN
jgi:DNA-binding response OmpR family regulator